jgi:hypothetical protein
MHLAKVPMAAWFQQQLRPHTPLSATGSPIASSTAGHREGGYQYHSRRLARTSTMHPSSSSIAIGSSGGSGSNGMESGGSVQAGVSLHEGDFREWVCEEEAAGMITFSVKGAGDLCLHRTLVTA